MRLSDDAAGRWETREFLHHFARLGMARSDRGFSLPDHPVAARVSHRASLSIIIGAERTNVNALMHCQSWGTRDGETWAIDDASNETWPYAETEHRDIRAPPSLPGEACEGQRRAVAPARKSSRTFSSAGRWDPVAGPRTAATPLSALRFSLLARVMCFHIALYGRARKNAAERHFVSGWSTGRTMAQASLHGALQNKHERKPRRFDAARAPEARR
ncbi:hypothetical protein OH77DRAFT_662537 [Trametes cingulata]|nr:hypothetical protein OH77DRAFT_662537 [Trametes cingulata]